MQFQVSIASKEAKPTTAASLVHRTEEAALSESATESELLITHPMRYVTHTDFKQGVFTDPIGVLNKVAVRISHKDLANIVLVRLGGERATCWRRNRLASEHESHARKPGAVPRRTVWVRVSMQFRTTST